MAERPARMAETPSPTVGPEQGSDADTTLAGEGHLRSLAGEDTELPQPVKQAMVVEGPATDARPGALTARLFQPGTPPRQVDLGELRRRVSDDRGFVWLDLSEYAERDLRAVAGLLGLHRVAVHSALSAWQQPRLDVFDGQFFVSVTVPRLDPASHTVQAGQLDLVVGRGFLVSAHKQPLPFAGDAARRAAQHPELPGRDPAYLLYILLDELLAHYEHLQEDLEDEVEQMEERALTDTSDRFLRDLRRFKRYAFVLSRLAEQHRAVFAAFLRPDFPFAAAEEVDVHFRDLEARLARVVDGLSAAKEAVNGAFDIYVSHVSHRTNAVMKTLTMLSGVLLPITVLLGFFGTNFTDIPMYTPGSFAGMVLAMVLLPAVTVALFRRRGWL
jgi:magnesium transporter